MMSTADARTRTVDASGAGSNRDAPMTVDQAKALLRGVKRKDKDKKGEKKKHGKKEKKEKHGKKDKKHGKKRRRRDGSGSDSDSSDDSDSDDRGAGKQRRWGGNNGVGDGGGKKKMEKTQWGSTPDATVEIPTITEDDYYLKNKEFSMWLQHTHNPPVSTSDVHRGCAYAHGGCLGRWFKPRCADDGGPSQGFVARGETERQGQKR